MLICHPVQGVQVIPQASSPIGVRTDIMVLEVHEHPTNELYL